MIFSGIITTTLGKTATFTKGAGRERRVHHSKSLPLLSIGERLFFVLNLAVSRSASFAKKYLEIISLNSLFTLFTVRAAALDGARRREPHATLFGAVDGGS
jgi:hypothetical protein